MEKKLIFGEELGADGEELVGGEPGADWEGLMFGKELEGTMYQCLQKSHEPTEKLMLGEEWRGAVRRSINSRQQEYIIRKSVQLH